MSDPFGNVRVKNIGNDAFRGMYDGRAFTIPPGGEAIIPTEAAVIHFGDGPFFRKDPLSARDREWEVQRIRGRYGCMPGFEGADQRWEQIRPHVEIYELDGTKWITVMDDPDGALLPEQTGAATLEQQMSYLQEQLARLQEQVDRRTGAPGQATVAQIPEDTPDRKPKRGRGRPPKLQVPADVEEMLSTDDAAEAATWAE